MLEPPISHLSQMTIRARVAFGLVCAERVTNHLGLANPVVETVFDSLWKYTSSENLEWWNCKGTARNILETTDKKLPMRDVLLLFRVMGQLDEIGGGNLYARFNNEITLAPTVALCRILMLRHISLPPAVPFIAQSPRTLFGIPNIRLGWTRNWGKPFDGCSLRRIASDHTQS